VQVLRNVFIYKRYVASLRDGQASRKEKMSMSSIRKHVMQIKLKFPAYSKIIRNIFSESLKELFFLNLMLINVLFYNNKTELAIFIYNYYV